MGNDLAGKKVAFLGTGKMGGIILQALLKSGLLSPASTCATVSDEERPKTLATKLGVKAGTSNVEAVKGADIIVIGVKPQVVEEVIEEISSHVTPFFFSSRRRHTRFDCDWSSDVCSSD